jgi:hypothetical protein
MNMGALLCCVLNIGAIAAPRRTRDQIGGRRPPQTVSLRRAPTYAAAARATRAKEDMQ